MNEITMAQARFGIKKAEREIAEIVTELESRIGLLVVGMTFSPSYDEEMAALGDTKPEYATMMCVIGIKVEP